MSDYTRLAADLKTEALRYAGEVTTGASPWDAITYEFLDMIQKQLITGVQFGPAPLPLVDWLWARSSTRGSFRLSLPVNAAKTNVATFTKDSTAVTTVSAIHATPNTYVGWRLVDIGSGTYAQRPWITAHTGTTITLNVAWTAATVATADWLAVPERYTVANALRLVSPLWCDASPYRIDVVPLNQLEGLYPTVQATAGVPLLAAEVAPSYLKFSHYWYDDTATTTAGPTIEYDYMPSPTLLDSSTDEPSVTFPHRHLLSLGAAYLIAFEKRDTIADVLWSRFATAYLAMANEERAKAVRNSSVYGRLIPRPTAAQSEGITWTATE